MAANTLTVCPRISVVIPVYNEEELLPHCLNALTSQNIQADTIYVIDNNSTDTSVKIAETYSNVIVLKQSLQGICASTKIGLDAAAKAGGIILRCDADSRPPKDWIAKVLTILHDNPDCIGATGPGISYDVGPIRKTLIQNLYMKPYFYFVGLALGSKPLFGSNFALKAEAWQKISDSTHLLQHQDIHDDIDISYHLTSIGSVIYDDALQMPISPRPFQKLLTIPKRYAAGMRSITLHWPEQAPWTKK